MMIPGPFDEGFTFTTSQIGLMRAGMWGHNMGQFDSEIWRFMFTGQEGRMHEWLCWGWLREC